MSRQAAACAHLRTDFTGGGLVDFGDLYYFTCSSGETDRLIRDLDLEEESMPLIEDGHGAMIHISVPQMDGWPKYGEWNGLKVCRWDDGHWFRYLLSDASRTRVYVFVCCT